MKRNKLFGMALSALFAALIAVGAFIRVPAPALPFTLQTLFVLLAGLLLGARLGSASALLYMFMGLIGLPVFTEGGGLAYLLRPSFGYIIGFAAAAWLTGRLAHMAERPGFGRLLCAGLAGLGVMYIIGLFYYYLISALYLGRPMGLWQLLLYCFILTAPGDILLAVLAAALTKRLLPLVKPALSVYYKDRDQTNAKGEGT